MLHEPKFQAFVLGGYAVYYTVHVRETKIYVVYVCMYVYVTIYTSRHVFFTYARVDNAASERRRDDAAAATTDGALHAPSAGGHQARVPRILPHTLQSGAGRRRARRAGAAAAGTHVGAAECERHEPRAACAVGAAERRAQPTTTQQHTAPA